MRKHIVKAEEIHIGRVIHVLAAILLLAVTFYGVLDSRAYAAEAKKYDGLKIRWATQPSQVQAVIAEELGYFKEEFESDGISVELRMFASGPPIVEAIAAGELDFAQVGSQPTIQAIANGINIKVIGAYQSSDGSDTAIIARNDSGIKSLEDLRGKKLGFTIGTDAHMMALQFLESVNLDSETVQLVNIQMGDINTSLESGNVDAAVAGEPRLSSILGNGTTHLVKNAVGFNRASAVIIGKTEFLDKYPEIVVRLLKVLDRSVKWSDEHRAESSKILSKRNGGPESSYEATFRTQNLELFLDDTRINNLVLVEEFLFEQGTIRKHFDLRDYINTSFLEKAGVNKP
jgi:sulfonate transport system substrate-binding protein